MKGRMGTTRPYRNRSVKRPMPTVEVMKRVEERHRSPQGAFVEDMMPDSGYARTDAHQI